MFRYYSLGGDTAMQGELYARLGQAFLAFVVFLQKQVHLPSDRIDETCSGRVEPRHPLHEGLV